MSGPPRFRSTNIAEPENKEPQNPVKKPAEKMQSTDSKSKKAAKLVASSVLRQKSMNGSCSSDVSTDSSHSRSSSSSSSGGRITAAGRRNGLVVRRKQCEMNSDNKVEKTGGGDGSVGVESGNVVGGLVVDTPDCVELKKRCAWITHSTDPSYITFHDEEWGVAVHDDKKLFELLCLSGALAEMTWPVILNKRGLFREVFLDFDPAAVSKLNDRKITQPGSPGCLLLSESKLRSIIENARQMCKVIDEFGSFDRYIWNFVNHKPLVNQFRNSRQVQVKNSKAEVISKDLVRRGFRSVGPTVVYSFMQVSGLTNDHLTSCFRFQECITGTQIHTTTALKSKNESKLESPIFTG